MISIPSIDHPLTIAEIFDRAVVLFVRRWQIVAALCALDAAPGVITRAANRGRPPVDNGAFYTMIAAEMVVSSVVFAALVRTFAAAQSSTPLLSPLAAALRDFPRSAGAFLVVWTGALLFVGIPAGAAFLGFGVGSRVGGSIGAIVASCTLGLMALCVAAPLLAVVVVAYPTTILERRGPLGGLAVAGKRVLRGGLRRGGFLAVAWLIVSLAPSVAADAVTTQIGEVTGQHVTGVFEPLVDSLCSLFATTAGVVAAIDYRNRREGTDLQAALERAPA